MRLCLALQTTSSPMLLRAASNIGETLGGFGNTGYVHASQGIHPWLCIHVQPFGTPGDEYDSLSGTLTGCPHPVLSTPFCTPAPGREIIVLSPFLAPGVAGTTIEVQRSEVHSVYRIERTRCPR